MGSLLRATSCGVEKNLIGKEIRTKSLREARFLSKYALQTNPVRLSLDKPDKMSYAFKKESYMNVNVKKLHDNARLPAYGSAYAAGADLYACEGAEIPAGETVFIHTGIAIELPAGTVGLVYARSGMACKQDLAPANKVGVIDCDYRGEVMVALHNHGKQARRVEAGDRIAQLVIAPYYTATFFETETLSDTVRGEGGFGSTGTK